MPAPASHLDVSVHAAVAVHVLQATQHLAGDGCDDRLGQALSVCMCVLGCCVCEGRGGWQAVVKSPQSTSRVMVAMTGSGRPCVRIWGVAAGGVSCFEQPAAAMAPTAPRGCWLAVQAVLSTGATHRLELAPHDRAHAAGAHVRHHHPQLAAVHKGGVQRQHVGVREAAHERGLLRCRREVGGGRALQVADLDRDVLAERDAQRVVHLRGVGTLREGATGA